MASRHHRRASAGWRNRFEDLYVQHGARLVRGVQRCGNVRLSEVLNEGMPSSQRNERLLAHMMSQGSTVEGCLLTQSMGISMCRIGE